MIDDRDVCIEDLALQVHDLEATRTTLVARLADIAVENFQLRELWAGEYVERCHAEGALDRYLDRDRRRRSADVAGDDEAEAA